MSRLYAKDIISKIKAIAQNNINVYIDTIRTERSDSNIPYISSFISDGISLSQYPEMLIRLNDSEIITDEEFEDSIENIPEVFNFEIGVQLLSIDSKAQDYACYYLEAMLRLFHGCTKDTDLTWVRCNATVLDTLMNAQNEIYKIVAVKIEVRVN